MKRAVSLLILAAAGVSAVAAETPRVRTFLTYNIYECRGADALGHAKTNWPGRYEREIGDIARIIRSVQPDWVVLQEVLKDGVDKVDQAARIAAESGLHMAEYVGAFEHRGGQWGAAILTREKPLATRGFVVGKDGRRPVVVAEFEDHVVYGTHLGLKLGQQQEEMAVIREKAMAETKPVILCGDMNIRNTDKGFKDLFEGFTWLTPEIEKTWPQVNPTWMCDYFFVTSRHADAFRKVRAWAIREPLASDHRPVALTVFAEEMIGVGEWHQRTVETAINLNRGYLAFKRGDRGEMLKYARAEYENARAALKLVERDSRLGWEPSMEYAAGPEQIRWKLNKMRECYGFK